MIIYSQHLDFKNEKFKIAGCGIMSLLMLMEYLKNINQYHKNNLPDPDKLYQIGLNRRSFIKGVGWRHTGLVGLAKLYGFKKSQAYDWSKLSIGEALINLKQKLANGPVIASVYSKYRVGRGGHLVVLLSLGKNKVIVLDPDSKTRKGIKRALIVDKFIKAWKKRIISIA